MHARSFLAASGPTGPDRPANPEPDAAAAADTRPFASSHHPAPFPGPFTAANHGCYDGCTDTVAYAYAESAPDVGPDTGAEQG